MSRDPPAPLVTHGVFTVANRLAAVSLRGGNFARRSLVGCSPGVRGLGAERELSVSSVSGKRRRSLGSCLRGDRNPQVSKSSQAQGPFLLRVAHLLQRPLLWWPASFAEHVT